jgi:hypothetical protein
MKKIKEFEIIDHGYEHNQYFQGCGVSLTRFDRCYTGAGYSAKEAYKDAVEQVYSSGEYDGNDLPKRPRGIRERDKVPAKYVKQEENEVYWYISVRIR